MILAPAAAEGSAPPPLLPALAAMTGLQAVVSLALFAPGVLAPKLGLAAADIGLFTTCVFAVGIIASVFGGVLADRIGPFAVATFCAVAVVCGMAAAGLGTPIALVAAGLLVGLAFGPETPASSALLGRIATPKERPLIFSVRQTGNQIGAMAGSLTLPLIAVSVGPSYGYAAVATIAVAAAGVFLSLRPRYDRFGSGLARPLDVWGSLALLRRIPELRRLALASMPWSALQMALNAFLVTFAVGQLALSHVTAGLLLATAQGGGLLGRLAWGAVAARLGVRPVLAGLGFAMAAAAVTVALAGPGWPLPLVFALVFLFGVTASGWNGVFLAEIARLAPEGRIAEATGAVLLASYSGLVAGPVLVATLADLHSLALSYAVIGALAGLATLPLLRADESSKP